MRAFQSSRIVNRSVNGAGASAIGIGLAVLLVALFWPAVPVVAAMALIVLGATDAMIARVRQTKGEFALILVHAAIYGCLYALFIGVVLDGSRALSCLSSNSQARFVGVFGIPTVLYVDLAVSTIPMAVAFARICRRLQRGCS